MGLARGPTPVEAMENIQNTQEDLARRLSVGSRGSRNSSAGTQIGNENATDDNVNPDEAAADSLLSQHQRQATLALQQAPQPPDNGSSKPLLFVLSATGRGDTGYEWQAMGVYDDEDLVEEDIFLLYVPSPSKSILSGSEWTSKT